DMAMKSEAKPIAQTPARRPRQREGAEWSCTTSYLMRSWPNSFVEGAESRGVTLFRTLAVALIVALLTTLPSGTSARQAAAELFTCSMHPHVVDAQPGTCSVCTMALKARAMSPAEKELVDFMKAYDAAFLAKDLAKLATMYTPE